MDFSGKDIPNMMFGKMAIEIDQLFRWMDFSRGKNEVDGAYNLGAITFQRDLEEHAQELARILKPGAAEYVYSALRSP